MKDVSKLYFGFTTEICNAKDILLRDTTYAKPLVRRGRFRYSFLRNISKNCTPSGRWIILSYLKRSLRITGFEDTIQLSADQHSSSYFTHRFSHDVFIHCKARGKFRMTVIVTWISKKDRRSRERGQNSRPT